MERLSCLSSMCNVGVLIVDKRVDLLVFGHIFHSLFNISFIGGLPCLQQASMSVEALAMASLLVDCGSTNL